jgi:hypothetical protein
VPRTTGRSAEVLREGSGIRVDGAAGPEEVTAYHVETGRSHRLESDRFLSGVRGIECLVSC